MAVRTSHMRNRCAVSSYKSGSIRSPVIAGKCTGSWPKEFAREMARGAFAGGTDYSRQPFSEIEADLTDWRKSLAEVHEGISQKIGRLEASGFWREVPPDLQAMAGRSLQLFETARAEVEEILEDFKSEVREDHVRRLRRVGQEAQELNNARGDTWHGDQAKYRVPGTYEAKEFFVVEDIYAEARERAADLIDLLNVSSRLEDFVGRKPSRVLKLEPEFWGISINVPKLLSRLWAKLRCKR
jgi:hypothetical protein